MDHVIKWTWLSGRKLLIVCNHPATFGSHRYCGSREKKISRDLKWLRVQRVVWLDGLKFLTVSHYYAKFYGPRPRGNSDTATNMIYVTLQDHLIKGSGDFEEGNSSLYIPTLPKLIIIDIVFMDIQLF